MSVSNDIKDDMASRNDDRSILCGNVFDICMICITESVSLTDWQVGMIYDMISRWYRVIIFYSELFCGRIPIHRLWLTAVWQWKRWTKAVLLSMADNDNDWTQIARRACTIRSYERSFERQWVKKMKINNYYYNYKVELQSTTITVHDEMAASWTHDDDCGCCEGPMVCVCLVDVYVWYEQCFRKRVNNSVLHMTSNSSVSLSLSLSLWSTSWKMGSRTHSARVLTCHDRHYAPNNCDKWPRLAYHPICIATTQHS